MQDLRLKIASPDEAGSLAEISKRAFESDIDHGAPSPGGPPGYDSPAWQLTMMKNASAYLMIMLDEQIVGGVIIFHRRGGHFYLARIFIDTDYHRLGLGLKATQILFERYPEATRWTLDTPAWNIRTHRFYQKLGFRIYKEERGLLYFEKLLDPI